MLDAFEIKVLDFIGELREVEALGLTADQTAIKFNEVGMKYGIASASKIVS